MKFWNCDDNLIAVHAYCFIDFGLEKNGSAKLCVSTLVLRLL